MTLVEKLFNCFKDCESFSLQDAYQKNPDKPQETVRARIYEKIGIKFERVAKGVYRTIDNKNEQCVLIEGNGRDLSMLKDGSIDCILTDHPWLDIKSNKGGTRAFASYDCFRYTLEDFKEKARVLKDGCFWLRFYQPRMRIIMSIYTKLKSMQKKQDLFIILKYHGKRGLLLVIQGERQKIHRI